MTNSYSRSMADQDSDRWIFEVLAPDIRRNMEDADAEGKQEWTDVVAQSLREWHERGGTREDIEEALRTMPFHPAMIRGVKRLKAATKPQTTFLCLSSANTVYISTILESKGLQNLFTEIVTNPAQWNSSGLLEVRRHVDPNGPQHNCPIGCNVNICKGEELQAFIKRHGVDYERIIYIGDGSNDFCPAVKLRKQDMVFCRKGRALERRIKQEGEKRGVVCQVQYWEGAWEVEELFGKLPDAVETS